MKLPTAHCRLSLCRWRLLLGLVVLGAIGVAQQPSNLLKPRVAGEALASQFGKWNVMADGPITGSGQPETVTIEATAFTLPDGTPWEPLRPGTPVAIGGDAAPETVTPITVNCGTGGPVCSFTAIFSHAHGGHFSVSSATAGLQEAINYEADDGGGTVIVDPDWAGNLNALLPALELPATVLLLDERSGNWTVYGMSHGSAPQVIASFSSATGAAINGLSAPVQSAPAPPVQPPVGVAPPPAPLPAPITPGALNGTLFAHAYDFTPVQPGVFVPGGLPTTITPDWSLPAGVVAGDTLYLSGGTGTAEAVTLTNVGAACTQAATVAISVGGAMPAHGPAGGGTVVSVSGSGFVAGATTVKFGSAAATGVVVNAAGTLLQAVAPAGSGTVNVEVIDANGDDALPGAYTYSTDVAGCGANCGNVGDPYLGVGPPPGQIPLSACALITAPGNYVLTGNVSGTLNGQDPACLHVYYAGGAVSLDLGGFTMSGIIHIEGDTATVFHGTVDCSSNTDACIQFQNGSDTLHHITVENSGSDALANIQFAGYSSAPPTTPTIFVFNVTSTVPVQAGSPRSRNIMDDGGDGSSSFAYPIDAYDNAITCVDGASACQGVEMWAAPHSVIEHNLITLPSACGNCSDSGRGIIFDQQSNYGIARFNQIEVNYGNRAVRVRNSDYDQIYGNQFDNIETAPSWGRYAAIHTGETNFGIDDEHLLIYNNVFQMGSGNGVTSDAASDIYVFDNTVTCVAAGCAGAGHFLQTDVEDGVAADQTGTNLYGSNNNVGALGSLAAGWTCGPGHCSGTTTGYTTLYMCQSGTAGGYGTVTTVGAPCPQSLAPGTAPAAGVSGPPAGPNAVCFTPQHGHSGSWTLSSATSGLQEAVNAAGQGGWVVDDEPVAAIYAPLVLGATVRLDGFSAFDGGLGSLIEQQTPNTDTIQVGTAGATANDVYLTHFDAAGVKGDGSDSGVAIHCVNCVGLKLDDVIGKQAHDGIYFDSAYGHAYTGDIENSHFIGDYYGVHIVGGSANRLTFMGNTVDGNVYGVFDDGGWVHTWVGNDIEANSKYGYWQQISQPGNWSGRNVDIISNYFEGNGSNTAGQGDVFLGQLLDGGSGNNGSGCSQCVLTGNIFNASLGGNVTALNFGAVTVTLEGNDYSGYGAGKRYATVNGPNPNFSYVLALGDGPVAPLNGASAEGFGGAAAGDITRVDANSALVVGGTDRLTDKFGTMLNDTTIESPTGVVRFRGKPGGAAASNGAEVLLDGNSTSVKSNQIKFRNQDVDEWGIKNDPAGANTHDFCLVEDYANPAAATCDLYINQQKRFRFAASDIPGNVTLYGDYNFLQQANGDSGLVINRATDTSPTGFLLDIEDQTNSHPLFRVDASGNVSGDGGLNIAGAATFQSTVAMGAGSTVGGQPINTTAPIVRGASGTFWSGTYAAGSCISGGISFGSGVLVGMVAEATPETGPPAGLVWNAYIDVNDHVTVNVCNITGSSVIWGSGAIFQVAVIP